MFDTKDQGGSLTFVLIVSAFVFSCHIALATILYGLCLGFGALWQKHRKLKPLLIGMAAVPIIWGIHAFATSPYSVGSTLNLVYLNALDWVTGFLHEKVGFSGGRSFFIARFLVRLLPISPIMTFGLLFRRYLRREKSHVSRAETPTTPELPSSRKLAKLRDSEEGAFIGVDSFRQPVYLSDYERGMHTQVIGSTGFGKTASVLMPLLAADLKRGKSVIFIDGKGDMESLSAFTTLVRETGREHDTYIFAPSFPNLSNPWNPLASGNPVVQKDRIVGAQIWSEEFYKKKGEDLLQTVLQIFDDLKITPSFPRLAQFLKNPDADFLQGKKFRDSKVEQDYKTIKTALKNDAKNYAGIIADINLFAESFLKPMFTAEKGEGISLYDIARNNKVVYFSFPVLMMEDTMKRIARMVIHDLKVVCSEIQNYVDKKDRNSISLFIDEFASFATENFVELLNKARSAGMGITIIHQSLGDIEGVDKNFARQIFENTNIKIVLRVDDPETIEQYCRMAGTRQQLKFTYQTDMDVFGHRPSGAASMREVDVFNIDPNTFRKLRVGDAVVMIKSSRKFYNVRLDYLNPPCEDLSMYAEKARAMVIDGVSANAETEETKVALPVPESPASVMPKTKKIKRSRSKLDKLPSDNKNEAA